jgi:hypothetical protein
VAAATRCMCTRQMYVDWANISDLAYAGLVADVLIAAVAPSRRVKDPKKAYSLRKYGEFCWKEGLGLRGWR